MFRLFGKRVTQRLNTVDFVDIMDAVELQETLEETFGIKIEDAECETLTTVGQLYEVISPKLAERPDFDPVWALICQIVREQSQSKDPIDHETTFFAGNAKPRATDPS
ncbi:MAG: hypothetical protein HUJ27_05680 [Rhodobacteraceae bacterium]|nr:hypothetical protein [Paracoccaceae bacterium]